MELFSSDHIPLLVKIGYSIFICVVLPINWMQYGPSNFLWFSDIALVTTAAALWLESPLLTSMMALSVVVLDVAWDVDFISGLIAGKSLTGLSSYMFNRRIWLPIRALSLFHVAFPVLLLWMLHRLGYDARALVPQTVLAWIILPLSYFLTPRSENINWVHGFGNEPQRWMSPRTYLLLLMILFPVVIYLPSHFLFKRIFG